MGYARASPNVIASVEIAEWASSGIGLENGKYLFVVPDYTPVPDVAYWYIISPDGKTIRGYDTNLPHGSVLLALCKDNGKIIATSMSDTSYDPSGPMGVYEYDASNNSWHLLFEYQGDYYRLDPWSIIPYDNMYIISGNLQEKGNSNKIGFVASFSKNGSLLWIKTFSEGGYRGITVYLFKNGDGIYAYIRGDSLFLGIVKVNPYSGDYNEVVPGTPDYSPFLILDRSGRAHSTVGLYRDGSAILKVYDFASGEWKEYNLSHQVQRSIYQAVYYNGVYFITYWGEDGNIYLTTLRGTEYRISSSSSEYTGAFLTDVTPGGYILIAYNAGYGFGRALTLNVSGISGGESAPATGSQEGTVILSLGESVNVTDYSGNVYQLSLLDVNLNQGRVLVKVTSVNPRGNAEVNTLDIGRHKTINGLGMTLDDVFIGVDDKLLAKLKIDGYVFKGTTILSHNITIIQKVQSNRSSQVVSNKTVKVEFRASTAIYKVKVSVRGVQKSGYLIMHNVTITNVRGNVEAFRTIYNISKDVAYSVDDMILPPNAIILKREPVIALDIKNPKEGEKVNQTIIVLTNVPNSKFTKGIKITHEVITQKPAEGKSKSTCGPGLILLMAMVPIALMRKQ